MKRLVVVVLLFAAALELLVAVQVTRHTSDRLALESLDLALGEPKPPLTPAALDTIVTPAPLETRGPELSDAAAAQEELARGPQWSLRVIDERSDALVPGADVYFFSPQRIAEVLMIEDPNVFFGMTQFYERYGLHRRTDELGSAEVPLVESSFWIVAMTPTLFGGAAFGPDAVLGGQLDVRVRPTDFLEVQVLSARDRRPLSGVAVAFRDEALMGFPIGAKSDAQGLARLGPCAARSNDEPARFVTVHGVFSRPVETWCRAGYALRPELLVPDSERLLVRIVDASGKTCPIDGELALEWKGRTEIFGPSPRLPIRAGTVSIPRVELGLKLSMDAYLGRAHTTLRKNFTMPNTARDQRVDMALDPATPIVRVKLLRDDGRAFEAANWKVSGLLSCAGRAGVSVFETGILRGSGTIAFALHALEGPPCEFRFAIQVHSSTGEDLGGSLRASLGPGINDQGELTLQPGSLLCSGFVVDSRGVGVAGRRIELGSPLESVSGVRGVPALLAATATSAVEGRFELRGWGETGEFIVRGSPGRVRLGQTGITVVVED